MTATSRTDLLIVGAGPAGSCTAALLARQGREVLLLDQASFPRDKACGEYLSPGALRLLRELFPSFPLSPSPVTGLQVSTASGRSFRAEFPIGLQAGAIRRTDLDFALVQEAIISGAQFITGARVDHLEQWQDAVLAHGRLHGEPHTWKANWLVAADGYSSRIIRSLGWNRNSGRSRYARVYHLEEPPAGEDVRMFARGDAVVGFGPMEGMSNITVVVDAVRGHSRKERESGRNSPGPTAASRLKDAPTIALSAPALATARLSPPASFLLPSHSLTTACGPRHSAFTARGRVIAVGDAACFVDPFTGEGIYFALKGATFAAAALQSPGAPSVRQQYRLERKEELERRYQLCGIVHQLLERPFLRDQAIRTLDSSPRLARILASAIGDLAPVNQVLNPRYIGELLWNCALAVAS